MATIRNGIASMASVMRMMRPSSQPPAQPDSRSERQAHDQRRWSPGPAPASSRPARPRSGARARRGRPRRCRADARGGRLADGAVVGLDRIERRQVRAPTGDDDEGAPPPASRDQRDGPAQRDAAHPRAARDAVAIGSTATTAASLTTHRAAAGWPGSTARRPCRFSEHVEAGRDEHDALHDGVVAVEHAVRPASCRTRGWRRSAR